MTYVVLNKRYSPKIGRRHKQWASLLRMFARFLDIYNEPPVDVAYWYGERALTGLLAAAAWKLNGWSLEEFTSLRKRGKQDAAARGDAWFKVGRTAFTVEAKTRWPQGTDPDGLVKVIERALAAASRQLKNMGSVYKAKTMKAALCYVVPAIPVESFSGKFRHIQKTFAELPKILGSDHTAAVSYWYAQKAPRHKDPTDGKFYVYPGVIVVARFWKRI